MTQRSAAKLDLLRDLGDWPRRVAAYVLAPFAFYFVAISMVSPLCAVAAGLITGNWGLAGIICAAGLMQGVFLGFPLWYVVRLLFRGKLSRNDVTIFPGWLIRSFGIFIGLGLVASIPPLLNDPKLRTLAGGRYFSWALMICMMVFVVWGMFSVDRLARKRTKDKVPRDGEGFDEPVFWASPAALVPDSEQNDA